MKSRVIFHSNGTCTYELDGKEVTEKAYKKAHRVMFEPGHVPSCAGNTTTCWPMYSEAMAVHPEQIPEAMERNKKHGVYVEYAKDGRAKLMDRGQRKALMRIEGYHDNNGGFGDDTGVSTTTKPPMKTIKEGL